ncbi:uncharacterized protein LOC134852903 [Symsagittifera roscoffensis]|uniref:uncharacterized protein LOC134852903 n=1 Tax=Symsagittifera roscoffensis TaxID=84072 RepID=UPI00307BA53C
MTSVLTHSAMTTGKDDDNSMKLLVAVLNGVLSVWTAAQMKLGWNQKYQSANSTLIKYRDMSGRVAMLCLILDCQKTKSAVGVVEFINNCYENEKNIMQSEIAIPTFIARKYRKAAISKGGSRSQSRIQSGRVSRASREGTLQNPQLRGLTENVEMGNLAQDGKLANNSVSPAGINKGGQQEEEAKGGQGEGGGLSKSVSMTSISAILSQSDKNLDSSLLLGVLLKRFRNLKWVYSFTAKYYYFLNLGCFYTPLLVFGTTNTILASIIIDESADNISSLVIKISTVVSVLTGLQMTLQWESESSKCFEAHHLYSKLDSETSYRLMLSEQGVAIKNAAEFAWKCKEIEEQTVDAAPAIPQYVLDHIRKLQNSKQVTATPFEYNKAPAPAGIEETVVGLLGAAPGGRKLSAVIPPI